MKFWGVTGCWGDSIEKRVEKGWEVLIARMRQGRRVAVLGLVDLRTVPWMWVCSYPDLGTSIVLPTIVSSEKYMCLPDYLRNRMVLDLACHSVARL